MWRKSNTWGDHENPAAASSFVQCYVAPMANLIEHYLGKLGLLDNFVVEPLTQNGRSSRKKELFTAFRRHSAQIYHQTPGGWKFTTVAVQVTLLSPAQRTWNSFKKQANDPVVK